MKIRIKKVYIKMREKVKGLICNEFGHAWYYGPDGTDVRECLRCGRKEKAHVESINKELTVEWKILNK